jgi:hypothetical protein
VSRGRWHRIVPTVANDVDRVGNNSRCRPHPTRGAHGHDTPIVRAYPERQERKGDMEVEHLGPIAWVRCVLLGLWFAGATWLVYGAIGALVGAVGYHYATQLK